MLGKQSLMWGLPVGARERVGRAAYTRWGGVGGANKSGSTAEGRQWSTKSRWRIKIRGGGGDELELWSPRLP